MAEVASIWRHPIKSHGREQIASVALTKGQTLPGDRIWAVPLDTSAADGQEWVPCAHFSRGAKTPALQAIQITTLSDGNLTVTHPDLPSLTFDPSREGEVFVDWTRALVDPDRAAQPDRLVLATERGMTDSPYPSISLMNLASHRAVEGAAGQALSPLRWRGNILLDGPEAWAEFDWIGHEFTLGTARIVIRDRIRRCNATRGNPETGAVDVDTLAILKDNWAHIDFGVYAEVIASGEVRTGDRLEHA
ncbi:MOSC domain-containing protein [Flavimaricola marinus]|uniref:MOSC domain protein n=1 Tax=Flavimaricola marinus TaxID=1819565 RepID=A0A238LAE3_9RHOB|nr:MOSC N-terminal beta barrel domain-containing protein [Flavimaricola marinus]SMY06384.1 MOSC domain protein [Flavimaricola marinus]